MTFSQAFDKVKAQGAMVIGFTSGSVERLAEFSSDTEKCAGKFAVGARHPSMARAKASGR